MVRRHIERIRRVPQKDKDEAPRIERKALVGAGLRRKPIEMIDQPYAGRLEDGEHRFAIRVYYEDTDAGGVVYHANYLRYFERARSDMMALVGADHVAAAMAGTGYYVIAEATLRYHRPARLGDALVVASRVEEVGSVRCVVQQRVMRGDELVAEGRILAVYVTADGRPQRQPGAWVEAFRAAMGARGA